MREKCALGVICCHADGPEREWKISVGRAPSDVEFEVVVSIGSEWDVISRLKGEGGLTGEVVAMFAKRLFF